RLSSLSGTGSRATSALALRDAVPIYRPGPDQHHEAGEDRPLEGVAPAQRVTTGGTGELPAGQAEHARHQHRGHSVAGQPARRQQPPHHRHSPHTRKGSQEVRRGYAVATGTSPERLAQTTAANVPPTRNGPKGRESRHRTRRASRSPSATTALAKNARNSPASTAPQPNHPSRAPVLTASLASPRP